MSNCELLHALLTRLVSYCSFLIPQLFQPTSSICKLYLPKNIWHRLVSFFSYVWSWHNHIALLGTCSLPTGPSHACNLHDCINNTFNKYTKCISSTYSCKYSDLIHLWQYIIRCLISTCNLKSSLVKFGCFFAMVVCSPPVWITTSIINILWAGKIPITYHVKKISFQSHNWHKCMTYKIHSKAKNPWIWTSLHKLPSCGCLHHGC